MASGSATISLAKITQRTKQAHRQAEEGDGKREEEKKEEQQQQADKEEEPARDRNAKAEMRKGCRRSFVYRKWTAWVTDDWSPGVDYRALPR